MRGRLTTVVSLLAVAVAGPVATAAALDGGTEDGRPEAPSAPLAPAPSCPAEPGPADPGEATPEGDAPAADGRPEGDVPAETPTPEGGAADGVDADCTPDDGSDATPAGPPAPAITRRPPAPIAGGPAADGDRAPGGEADSGADPAPGGKPTPDGDSAPEPEPTPEPAPATAPPPVAQVPAPAEAPRGIRIVAPEPGPLPVYGPEPIGVVLSLEDPAPTAVELTDGRRTLCRWSGPPYTCAWRPAVTDIGWFSLRAIATHADGGQSTSRVSVQVPRHQPVGVTQLAWAAPVRGRARVVTIGHVAPPPALPTALACRGHVQVRVSRGGRTVGFQRVRLNRYCGFTSRLLTTVNVAPSDVLRVQTLFPGNPMMSPARPPASPVRAGGGRTKLGTRSGLLAGIAKATTGRTTTARGR